MMSLNEKIDRIIENDEIDRNALERILDVLEISLDRFGFEIIATEMRAGEIYYVVKIKNR